MGEMWEAGLCVIQAHEANLGQAEARWVSQLSHRIHAATAHLPHGLRFALIIPLTEREQPLGSHGGG